MKHRFEADSELPSSCPYRKTLCVPGCEGTVPVASMPVIPFGALGLVLTLKMCPDDPARQAAEQELQALFAALPPLPE
jgi:hypothetical protein